MSQADRSMRRDKVKRYIEVADLVVVVDVPVIYAPEEPDEPFFEPETLRFLDEVTRHAEAGDRRWLAAHARIYEAARA